MTMKFNRRGFIKKGVIALIGAQLGYLFFDSFKKKGENEEDQHWYEVGPIGNLEANTIYPFQSGQFYLSVLEDGGILAFSVKCTHLGCVIQAQKDGFICPCHASSFNKYGEVMSPPATRALDTFDIKVRNGILFVDHQNAKKRSQFEKPQITYA
ncbi:ubiquinol-cytochrome c reductase iron-sulfur subunit [Lentimicrobium sp. S6]|uniref:QcrA and Rieske domain-containing protein n=1 Tax=Lentimicrobium sp. S6 TaxID=2735872 RepID=UPI001555621D|nr:Rieske (2Fe-2S) protein [Lentimicrobium sp. S6]NPD47911.1 Rieske (2Fe-2S) protein [Lentimicrobium sp. S6]